MRAVVAKAAGIHPEPRMSNIHGRQDRQEVGPEIKAESIGSGLASYTSPAVEPYREARKNSRTRLESDRDMATRSGIPVHVHCRHNRAPLSEGPHRRAYYEDRMRGPSTPPIGREPLHAGPRCPTVQPPTTCPLGASRCGRYVRTGRRSSGRRISPEEVRAEVGWCCVGWTYCLCAGKCPSMLFLRQSGARRSVRQLTNRAENSSTPPRAAS